MFDFVVASLPSYRSALSGGQTEQAESMPAPPVFHRVCTNARQEISPLTGLQRDS